MTKLVHVIGGLKQTPSWLLLTDGFHLVRLAVTVEQKKKHSHAYERVFECGHCGLMIDRDLNAAINLSKAVN
ncbi:zinc ribbon domain-containing protein [Scytonema sp. PCC 10023]|uniref:zinc ribbon domain-containing protein n=1 Tax=Scytonema sp. PCC 10023 TaxID=1680591 RepID=UPI0039C5F691